MLPNRSRGSFRTVGIPLPGLAATRERSPSADSSSEESCPPTPIETVELPTFNREENNEEQTVLPTAGEDEADGGFQAARMFQFLERKRPAVVPRPTSGPAARTFASSRTATATATPSALPRPLSTGTIDYHGGPSDQAGERPPRSRPHLPNVLANLLSSIRVAAEVHAESPPIVQTLAIEEEARTPQANLNPFEDPSFAPLPESPIQDPFRFSTSLSVDLSNGSRDGATSLPSITPSGQDQSATLNPSSDNNETSSLLNEKTNCLVLELENKTEQMDTALRLMDEIHVVEEELKGHVQELSEAK